MSEKWHPASFAEMAERALRSPPYRWQVAVAEAPVPPELIAVETGAGKTAGVVLPWLWRRRFHPDPKVREATPHWLVLCLPLRSLTEQVESVVRRWIGALGLDGLEDGVAVHLVMGGRVGGRAGKVRTSWYEHPEQDAVVVGTVDMLLSRALNRGYATSRFSWPIDFGLLHNGTHWVFDEIQLLGPALATSLQLEAFRHRFGTCLGSFSTWMSATVDRRALSTVDSADVTRIVELSPEDVEGALATRLQATRTIRHVSVDDARRARSLARTILDHHRPGTLTIAVMNTVRSARELYRALEQEGGAAPVHLLHSRFRPDDRRIALDGAMASPPPAGRIVVSTQVLEAGVDISASTMLIEAASWPSVVQRAGRLNRSGEVADALLLWVEPSSSAPYLPEDVDAATGALRSLEGRQVTAGDLRTLDVPTRLPTYAVLRASDLKGLFDTSPDLSGSDIDVAPFIRAADELDAYVAWRELDGHPPAADDPGPAADELCPVPVGKELAELAERTTLWRFDHLKADDSWVKARSAELRPGSIVVVDTGAGGYSPEVGWDVGLRAQVDPIPSGRDASLEDPAERIGDDAVSFSVGRWVSLSSHLEDVARATEELLDSLGPQSITAAQRDAAILAARLHDVGKAHAVFQETMLATADEAERPALELSGPWAKSGGARARRHSRPHFRHELVSLLALLGNGAVALERCEEPDLVRYLVAAHHGRIRMSIRSVAGDRTSAGQERILGVQEGDRIPSVVASGVALPEASMSFAPVRMGRDPNGNPSWSERALVLRDRPDVGPFRLAFFEAVVRLADWRASAREAQGAAV